MYPWLSIHCSAQPLPRGTRLNDATVTLTIPADRGDIFSIGHVGLWCLLFNQDFGHVDISSSSVRGVPRYEEVVPTEPPVREIIIIVQGWGFEGNLFQMFIVF